ncbi:phospholipid carrier-dependent glycosyltransferase, partial [Fischerella thermalis WC542]
MSHPKNRRKQFKNLLILSMIWLLGAVCDRIWFALDNSIPAWDQADYLTGTLIYWQALQHPQFWDSQWWQNFWMLSSKIPPLTYIVGAVVQNIFGTGPDQAALIMLLFSAVLLGSVYGLGAILFSETVGLWAAALCQVMPALYKLRLDFLLDYPLAAVVTLSFFCLTLWKVKARRQKADGRWQKTESHEFSPHHPLWAAAFGLSLGLALMVKQTALFFLLTPIVWVGFGALRQRCWGKLFQLLGALCLSILVFSPWYRTNWLLILTSGKRATIDSAIAEGDAPLNTLQAWTYYWEQLPEQVSLPLLVVPIVALLIYWGRSLKGIQTQRVGDKEKIFITSVPPNASSLRWLVIFLVGAYFLSSLNPNKDARYVLPYLPTLSVLLAYGFTR